MDIKKQILSALGLNEEQVKLGFQAKSEDGGTIFVSTAEELENGVDVSVLLEDGTTIPVPPGTYKLDTGVSFRVKDEGIVDEVLQSETEEEDTTEEVEASEELAEDDDKEADVGDWSGLEKRIENLEIAVAHLKEDKEGGDDDVEEMAEEVAEPSTNPKTITTKEVKEFSAEDEIKNLKAENEKLKTELAESPADAPINTNKFSSERATPTKQQKQRMTKQEKYLYNLYK